MQAIKNINFSQVKLAEINIYSLENLITIFKLRYYLKLIGIITLRGTPTIEFFFIYFLMILEKAKSVHACLTKCQIDYYRTPLNNFLNNAKYNWRKLLAFIATWFTLLYPAKNGKTPCVILDDSPIQKTGRRVELLSWLYDHSKGFVFTGYEFLLMVWSNGVTCIPLDFILKIGNSRCKKSKNGNYEKDSHIAQRRSEAKEKKTTSSIFMLARLLKYRIAFDYVLWDSWFNCSESFHFVFKVLLKRGKHLITMLKLSKEKHMYDGEEKSLKEIFKSIKKWSKLPESSILFKCTTIGI